MQVPGLGLHDLDDGAEAAKAGDEAGPAEAESVESTEDLIISISEQTRHVIGAFVSLVLIVGIWLIWRDVLPALEALESVRLWTTMNGDHTNLVLHPFLQIGIGNGHGHVAWPFD